MTASTKAKPLAQQFWEAKWNVTDPNWKALLLILEMYYEELHRIREKLDMMVK